MEQLNRFVLLSFYALILSVISEMIHVFLNDTNKKIVYTISNMFLEIECWYILVEKPQLITATAVQPFHTHIHKILFVNWILLDEIFYSSGK